MKIALFLCFLFHVTAADELPSHIQITSPTNGQTLFFPQSDQGYPVNLAWTVNPALLNGAQLRDGLVLELTINQQTLPGAGATGAQVRAPGGYLDMSVQIVDADKRPVTAKHSLTFVVWPVNAALQKGQPEPIPKRPKLSIIYVTKRPGGYDVLLNALAAQTSKDYELIAIDELERHRGEYVKAMAEELGVNLAVIRAGKHRTKKTPHGLGNAWNTGFLEASGDYITVMNDYSWLPADFVARTITFFDQNPDAILGYPSTMFMVPDALWDPLAVNSDSVLSTFVEPITQNPSLFGWERIPGLCFSPENSVQGEYDMAVDGYVRCKKFRCFWDGGAYSIPWHYVERLNGIDESIIDLGEDAQNNNMQDRAAMLGAQQWVDAHSWISLLAHQAVSADLKWRRDFSTTNRERWEAAKAKIWVGIYPISSPNSFSLRDARRRRLNSVDLQLLSPESSHFESVTQRFLHSFAHREGATQLSVLIVMQGNAHTSRFWDNGLRHALDFLQMDLQINCVVLAQGLDVETLQASQFGIEARHYDVVLGLGEFGGPIDRAMALLRTAYPHMKTGLIISGRTLDPPEYIGERYDVLYSETEWYLPWISHHKNALVAFGINTLTFKPQLDVEKIYDVIFVGAFLPNRQPLKILEYPGARKLAIGRIEHSDPTSVGLAGHLQAHGVEVRELFNPDAPSLVTSAELCALISQSKLAIFPMTIEAGGESSVLEARMCGAAELDINVNNPKLESLAQLSPIPSHTDYAVALVEGIRRIFEDRTWST